MELIQKIKKNKIGKIVENINISTITTYRVGGSAKAIVYPKSVEKLIKLIKILRADNIKYKVIGKCSNLIFSSKYYDGILINLSCLDKVLINKTVIKVGAGNNLITLANKLSKMGYTGLEFATGIPGTVGGAVYMNAGAYKSDMGYIVSEVRVLTPDLKIKTLYNKDLDFHYRSSFLQKNDGYICLEATLVLKNGDKKAIMDLIEDRRQKRLMSQPLEFPSAGSVFRNPKDDFAGRLIEECGLKGKRIGGACVSDKHANFIINISNATAEDVYELISLVKKEVNKKYDIDLLVEQEFVNWE